MNYQKTIYGSVIQIFNDRGQCIQQTFLPHGEDFQDEHGEPLTKAKGHYPTNMIQPVQERRMV